MMAEGLRGGKPSCSTPSISSSCLSAMAPPLSSAASPLMPQVVDGGAVDLQTRNWDNNLGSLCQHVEGEGWSNGAFSDIVVKAMGSTFNLHRLILSRSSYFRNMLQGPWREAGKPEVILHIDDENVNAEAVAAALAYLYGVQPQLDDSNAFRVLAAASFLDLQDLCALCTDFIISELWTENFLGYQAFAESQDYGVHGERVRKACWGYLCRGAVELREILPKLSTQTLRNLLTSDELWVPNEEKRFELALSVLVARGGLLECNTAHVPDVLSKAVEADSTMVAEPCSFSGMNTQEQMHATKVDGCKYLPNTTIDCSKIPHTCSSEKPTDQGAVNKLIQSTILELADSLVAMQDDDDPCLKEKDEQSPNEQLIYAYESEKDTVMDKFENAGNQCETAKYPPQACRNADERHRGACAINDFPAEGSSVSHMSSDDFWSYRSLAGNSSASSHASTSFIARSSSQSKDVLSSWGGRVVERRLLRAYPASAEFINNDDWEAFVSVFEGGGILYCHVPFEDLLNIRGQLEEYGFPCKSVADGLWLQTLLRQQVLTIAADTCKNCCFVYPSCTCRQGFVYSHTRIATSNYHREDERNSRATNMGSFALTDSQGVSNGSLQGRVHVRGTMDGLAGIGRGTTFGPPGTPWPSSRFVYLRMPTGGHSNRCNQQNLGNDQGDGKFDLGGMDMPVQSANGLTAVVGLTQGLNNGIPVHSDQSGRLDDQSLFARVAGEHPCVANFANTNTLKGESHEQSLGQDWESCPGSSISLDLQTPLRSFPPFRFGVEFEDVHRLADGQSKHSPEAFYAGSLWKVSVQAFNDEDPRGRRTLGLFLHRRKADDSGPYRKVSVYTDSREKVTARYQLICPAKRGVMILGNLTQPGTLLPKSPKGWGWRTAFLFDELADLLQGISLRVAAVVQLV